MNTKRSFSLFSLVFVTCLSISQASFAADGAGGGQAPGWGEIHEMLQRQRAAADAERNALRAALQEIIDQQTLERQAAVQELEQQAANLREGLGVSANVLSGMATNLGNLGDQLQGAVNALTVSANAMRANVDAMAGGAAFINEMRDIIDGLAEAQQATATQFRADLLETLGQVIQGSQQNMERIQEAQTRIAAMNQTLADAFSADTAAAWAQRFQQALEQAIGEERVFELQTRPKMEVESSEQDRAIEQQKLAVQKELVDAQKAQGMGTMLAAKKVTGFLGQLISDPKKMAGVAALISSAYGLYRFTKMGMGKLEEFFVKPKLVSETTRLTWLDKMRGVKLPKARKPEEVIMSPEKKKVLLKIAEQFKRVVQTGDELKNLLFYGPPGTGKTMFATILARWSGLHYAIIKAPAIFKFAEGNTVKEAIKEIDRIFDWAKNSPIPVIIFIDEADALLPARKDAFSGPARLIVNHFLGIIDKPSSPHFALILTTNLPGDIDEAAWRRTADQIEFDLPALAERVELLKLYLKKEVVVAGIKVNKQVQNNLKVYAKDLAGFAPRGIEELAKEARREVRFRKVKVLDHKIMSDVVADKKRQLEFDQKRKEYDISTRVEQFMRRERAAMAA